MSRWPAGLALTLAALAAGALPAAPALAAALSETYPAPPYTLTVVSPSPASVEADARFRVAVSPAAGTRLRAYAAPGFGIDATPVRARVAAGPEPGDYTVDTSFPVRGGWALVLNVAGPAGPGGVTVPVTVAAPGAMPIWLGWAIGLSPLLGLAVFLAFQVRAAGRLGGAAPGGA